MTTTVRAANSAMLSVASVPRKAAAVLPRVAHREVVAQEAAPRAVVLREVVIPPESRTVAAVALPVMMTTITTRRAAVAEAVGDSFCHKTDKTCKKVLKVL